MKVFFLSLGVSGHDQHGIVVMIDVISLLLSAIGIYLNAKAKKSLEEKVEDLILASSKVGEFHDFLTEAKSFHDNYESVLAMVINPMIQDVERDFNNSTIIKGHLSRFFNSERRVVNNRSIRHVIGTTKQEIPKPIKNNIDDIQKVYPEIQDAVNRYQVSLHRLHELWQDENFGRDLRNEIHFIQHQASRITINADKVILNSVPIIIFLNYEAHRSLESLR